MLQTLNEIHAIAHNHVQVCRSYKSACSLLYSRQSANLSLLEETCAIC